MRPSRAPSWWAVAALVPAFIPACTADEPAGPAPPAAADDSGLRESLEACGLLGTYEVASVVGGDGACNGVAAAVGGALLVDARSAWPVLTVGGAELPIRDGDDACGFVFEGCATVAEVGDADTLSATVGASADGVLVTIEARRWRGFRPASCPALSLSARRTTSTTCRLEGRYEVAVDAELVAGQCDLSWPAATVEVELGGAPDGPGVVRWDGSEHELAALDEARCSFVAETSSLDLLTGALRTTRLDGRLDGDTLSLAIEDDLAEGEQACRDARFEATATRLPGPPLLASSCEPLAYECGDGACDAAAGEDCAGCAEDCGCSEGECVATDGTRHLCVLACSDVLGNDCPAGQRCVSGRHAAYDGLMCVPAGRDAATGEPCEHTGDCASEADVCIDGACHVACDRTDPPVECFECVQYHGLIGGCRLACPPDGPNLCEQGETCLSTGGGGRSCGKSGDNPYVCHPSDPPAYLCQDAPAEPRELGAECPDDRCGIGFVCVGENCIKEGADAWAPITCEVARCSTPCTEHGDCQAPFTHCWVQFQEESGYCVTKDPATR